MTTHQLDPQVRDSILNRLRRVEGQVQGLQRMVMEDRDAQEVLNQMYAGKAALAATLALLLREVLSAYASKLTEDGVSKLEEIATLLRKFAR